jgi:hypothetical protein
MRVNTAHPARKTAPTGSAQQSGNYSPDQTRGLNEGFIASKNPQPRRPEPRLPALPESGTDRKNESDTRKN